MNKANYTSYIIILNLSRFNKKNIRNNIKLHLKHNDDNFEEDYDDNHSLKELLRTSTIYHSYYHKNDKIGLTTKIYVQSQKDLEAVINHCGIVSCNLQEQILECTYNVDEAIKNMQDCISGIYINNDLIQILE
jgi:hypothetical protein